MRTLRILEHITLDGIIQAPGGPDEESGYPYGGWAASFHDDAAGEAITAAQGERFDLLLGRRTYDIFASYWPGRTGPMADALNKATKYVATHRPGDLGWGPVQPLDADIVEAVRAVKSSDGPDLILWGSSTLTPLLIEAELAEEILLLVFPVLLGTGKSLFSGCVSPRTLALAETRATESGVLINRYRPAGVLRTATIGETPE